MRRLADANGDGQLDLYGVQQPLSANLSTTILLNGNAAPPPPPPPPVPSPPPTVSGEQVIQVGETSATVGANINPNGADTQYHVEWGTASSYGSAGPSLPAGSMLAGRTDQSVAAQLTGLARATAYHWRIVATSAGGTAAGPDQTLVTAANPPPSAAIAVTPATISNLRTQLSAAGSSAAPGSPIVSYGWDWNGNGSYAATCGKQDALSSAGCPTGRTPALCRRPPPKAARPGLWNRPETLASRGHAQAGRGATGVQREPFAYARAGWSAPDVAPWFSV